jgi:hypothetical protein
MCLVDEQKSGAILWNYFFPLALQLAIFISKAPQVVQPKLNGYKFKKKNF